MKIKKMLAVVMPLILLLLWGCQNSAKTPTFTPGNALTPLQSKVAEGQTNKNNEASVRCVLTTIDTTAKKINVYDIDAQSSYNITYTGGTDLRNSYDKVIAASQLKQGGIYDIEANASGKAGSIHESKDMWEKSSINNYSINESTSTIDIGSTRYKYGSGIVAVSQGKKITLGEIISADTVTIRGYDKTVYSVAVENGHGYIKLTGVDSFIGGFVDVGTKLCYTVTKDMMITAPEGEYKVLLQKGSFVASKTIVVKRNEEVTADYSECTPEPVEMGSIAFTIKPANAIMYIDGVSTDYSGVVNLSYGKHSLLVTADGYTSYKATVNVASVYSTKTIELTVESTTATSATSATKASTASGTNSTSAANASTAAQTDLTTGYTVTLKGMEGAAVYVDNVYMGLAPVTIQKSAGKKTITISRTGYETKSFTIDIANAAGNLTYEFPELETASTTSTAASE